MLLKWSMLLSCAVLTMTAQELVQPNLEGFKYPVVAKSLGIQETIKFLVTPDAIQLVSGSTMLAAAARSNLGKWAVPYASDTPLSVTYVFRLTVDTVQVTEVDEPIGDRFDRFFLRLLRLPVTRRVKKYNCTESRESSPVFKNETKDGRPSIEVTVEAQRGTCLQTTRVALAALGS